MGRMKHRYRSSSLLFLLLVGSNRVPQGEAKINQPNNNDVSLSAAPNSGSKASGLSDTKEICCMAGTLVA